MASWQRVGCSAGAAAVGHEAHYRRSEDRAASVSVAKTTVMSAHSLNGRLRDVSSLHCCPHMSYVARTPASAIEDAVKVHRQALSASMHFVSVSTVKLIHGLRLQLPAGTPCMAGGNGAGAPPCSGRLSPDGTSPPPSIAGESSGCFDDAASTVCSEMTEVADSIKVPWACNTKAVWSWYSLMPASGLLLGECATCTPVGLKLVRKQFLIGRP